MNPTKSVSKWTESLMTEIDPEMIPPIASTAIKITEIMMTIISLR